MHNDIQYIFTTPPPPTHTHTNLHTQYKQNTGIQVHMYVRTCACYTIFLQRVARCAVALIRANCVGAGLGATVSTWLTFINVCKQATERTYRGVHASLTYYITYYTIVIIIVIIGNIHIRYMQQCIAMQYILTNACIRTYVHTRNVELARCIGRCWQQSNHTHLVPRYTECFEGHSITLYVRVVVTTHMGTYAHM